MIHYAGKVTRTFKVVVSVAVDKSEDPKHQKELDQLCNWIFEPLKKSVDTMDGGLNRLSVDVRRDG